MINDSKNKGAYYTSCQIKDLLENEYEGVFHLSQNDNKKVEKLLIEALVLIRYGDRRRA